MISNKVCKLFEFPNESVWYRVNCSCGCNKSLDVELEKEVSLHQNSKYNLIYLRLYKTVYINIFSNNWIDNLFKRIRISLRILFFGKYEMYDEFMFQDPDHIKNFIEALKEGQQKLQTGEYNEHRKVSEEN
jgi:hypothetical protein